MKGERLHSPSMARFRAELLGCGSRGMRSEIFAQAGGDFGHGGVDILVHGHDDVWHCGALNGLIVIVNMLPDDGVIGRVVQFELQREAGDERGFIDAVEADKVAAENVIAANAAADAGDSAILAGATQSSHESGLNHIRRRFGPAVVIVGAELNRAGPVHDAVITIELRGDQPADQQADGKSGAGRNGGRRSDINDVVLDGARGATSGYE